MSKIIYGLRIQVRGIVQGVGFRPFIYNLALEYNLKGWVKNNSTGVEIEVNGDQASLNSFARNIETKAPPLAKINHIHIEPVSPNGYTTFEILTSTSNEGEFVPVSPDISVCEDCLKEFNDPLDRRYHYPFLNCTNCGPRFTIIKDIPYDRPLTSMAGFKMCQDCAAEYNDPVNRRFHAQPIACPDCGPRIWIEGAKSRSTHTTNTSTGYIISTVQKEFRLGSIIAIKGLGGFHLACDATNPQAVQTLRLRKKRDEKPFALMMPDLDTVIEHCYITDTDKNLLGSPEKPIVILRKRPGSNIVAEVAPGQETLGVMLPYTPLHYLLFTDFPEFNGMTSCRILVMTSGNISDEPITYENQEAKERLADIADVFLMHDRPIHIKCDDSVARTVRINTSKTSPTDNTVVLTRRARGYTPVPLDLPWVSRQILAVGAELKNTVCLTRNEFAFTSQFIGDLQNYETYESFLKTIDQFEKLYRINPELLACDLHPDYLSTRYAIERAESTGRPVIQVQHHHAHIASVMAENGIRPDTPVIGLAFDGTGYGDDGNIWGGEILIARYQGYLRSFHLDYFPLPGGDYAIKNPSRTALALLWKEGIDWLPDLPCTKVYCAEDLMQIKSQLVHQINTPLTSSMGRLFDAIASLIGVRQKVNYEAQAAIELEAICDPIEKATYEFEFTNETINLALMVKNIVEDYLIGAPVSRIAAKFHNTIIRVLSHVVDKLAGEYGIKTVALSGGVFQNIKLLEGLLSEFQDRDYNVLFHQKFPTNDGGVSLGQAAVAHHQSVGSLE
jgi:hydrogenase maturation protein HypF